MSSNPSAAHPAQLPGTGADAAVLSQILEAELQHICSNRHPKTPENVVARGLVGLALSGGGIRSATTNLGVLQALSRMEILPMVDYLSTVSGGGYIGACLSSLLTGRRPAEMAQCDPCARSIYADKEAPTFTTSWDKEFPFRAEFNEKRERPVGGELVAHLRTHGNFLIARWGLLRRETMRSIGNLLTGTTYSVALFLLTLLTFSALYLTLAWLIAPRLLEQLRSEPSTQTAMLHPMLPSDSAVVRVRKDPCKPGTQGCEVETRTTLQAPTAVQRIIQKASLVGAAFVDSTEVWPAGKWPSSLAAGWAKVQPPLKPLLIGLATGAAFSILVLVALRILTSRVSGSGQRKEELGPGESAEDVSERRVLKRLALAALLVTFFSFLWFRVSQSDTFLRIRVSETGELTGSEQFAWLLVPFAVLAGARLASLLIAMLIRSWTRRMRSLWGGFQAITIFGWWITLVFAALPLVIYGLRDYTGAVGIGAVSSLILTRLLTSRTAAKRRFAMPTGLRHALLGVAVACVIALGVLFFAVMIVPAVDNGNVYWILVLAAVPLFALAFLVNPNKLSPHYFYQDRLAETYLLSELADPEGGMQLYRDAMEMPLHCLHDPPAGVAAGPADPKPRNTAPYHLISAAINLAGSRDLTRKDRKSGYWLFSKFYCGSTHTGFRPTTTYHKGEMKVAQAIAISGAAASSAIGQDTFFAQAFAMVLFNIRLGFWLENPKYSDRRSLTIWPRYLWDEIAMHTIEHSKLVNLSDGGHTGDNVGIYPLLQRRCKVIIACDAERDPAITFGSFTEALRHAYIDMGIGVDIDLTLIRPDSTTGMSRSHCAVGRIRYPDRPDQESYLIYLKNSLNGDEPEPVLNYKSRFSAFPHETTADQFFDDAQFESYRALGVHLAEHTFGQWILSKRFAALRAHHGPVG